MSDLYAEVLVKRQATTKDKLIKAALVAGTAVALLVSIFINPLLLVVAVALGVACYFIFPKTDLEYEYLFVNGELDIDVIMAKMKRKRVKSYQMQEVEIIAPLDSHRVDYYKGNTRMKTLDYSSGVQDHKRFLMVVNDSKEGACKVLLEPGDELAEYMKKSAPSKIFLD